MAFCNQCGAELPVGARFCGSCGAAVGTASTTDAAPAPPPAASFAPSSQEAPVRPAGGGSGWILPVLVVVALLGIAYLLLGPKSGDRAGQADLPMAARGAGADTTDTGSAGAGRRESAGSVSAAVLDSAFNSDPAGAAARYAGPIRVSGTIASMVQPGGTPSLSMEGRTRFNFMVVNFPEGYRERLAPLYKGQFISVSCNEVRSLTGTTILSGCMLD